MTELEAIRILDPETSREALLPFAYDQYLKLKTVEEACRIAAAKMLDMNQTTYMSEAVKTVLGERKRQIEKVGDESDNHPFEWMSILGEEYGELCEAVNETFFQNAEKPERGGYDKIIKEASHTAAVAVAIIESAMKHLNEAAEK